MCIPTKPGRPAPRSRVLAVGVIRGELRIVRQPAAQIAIVRAPSRPPQIIVSTATETVS